MRGLIAVVLALPALAAPPVPRLVSPLNNAWAGPSKSFVVGQEGSAVLTSDFTHFEVEMLSDAGLAGSFWCTNSPGSASRSCTFPGVRDAGDYTWHARTLDGGERSAWCAEQPVRWDPDAPEAPPSLSVDAVDGGLVQLSWPAATPDPLSGIANYHVLISSLPRDAGLNSDAANTLGPGLTRNLFLGPGVWDVAVHTHDVADNVTATNTYAPGPVVVPVSLTLSPPTPPFWVQGDGGLFLTTGGSARFRWVGALDGGTFIVGQRGVQTDGGLRPLSIRLSTDLSEAVVSLYSEGLWQLLVAQSREGEVSDWSAGPTLMVEARAPPSPRPLSAITDGGLVALSWPEVSEFGAVRSGMEGYRLDRASAADASVTLGWFDAGAPDGSVSFVDFPGVGAWRYEVRAFDRAGNGSTAAVALLTVRDPPVLAAPTVASVLSPGPVVLSWEDGGPDVLYELQRLAPGDPSGPFVVQGSPMVGFVDLPPDGPWQYVLRGNLPPLAGPWSSPSVVVLVDSTPPSATLSALRRAPGEVLLEWTAQDTGSGLASVMLERQTGGAVVSLGAVTSSPSTETPPDGAHAYRVVAVDLAGHRTETTWTAELQTPGPVVAINSLAPVTVTCGGSLQLQLEAGGDGAVTWTILDGPAGATLDESGGLRWTPSRDDSGARTVRVRAKTATSVAETDVEVVVSCERRMLGLGCATGGGLWAALCVLLLLRRRG
jgi:hypothetical protein